MTEQKTVESKNINHAVAALLSALIETYDQRFSERLIGKSLAESIPIINERYKTSFVADSLPAVPFIYTLSLAMADYRADVAFTSQGKRNIETMFLCADKEDNFLIVRNENDLSVLERRLSERKFNMFNKTRKPDAKGRFMYKLGYKDSMSDPMEPIQQRGLVWFKDDILEAQGIKILERTKA